MPDCSWIRLVSCINSASKMHIKFLEPPKVGFFPLPLNFEFSWALGICTPSNNPPLPPDSSNSSSSSISFSGVMSMSLWVPSASKFFVKFEEDGLRLLLCSDSSFTSLLSCTSSWGMPQHHGHKGDLGITSGTCGAVGERAQVIL